MGVQESFACLWHAFVLKIFHGLLKVGSLWPEVPVNIQRDAGVDLSLNLDGITLGVGIGSLKGCPCDKGH